MVRISPLPFRSSSSGSPVHIPSPCFLFLLFPIPSCFHFVFPFPLSPSSFTPHPPPLPPHFPIQLILLPCECVTFSLCAYLRLATAERTCKPSVRRCVYIRVRLYWGVSINRYVNVHTCVQLYITPESGTLSSHPPFSLEHTLTYVILARGKNCT